MNIISPKLHGVLDYLIVLFLWCAPTMMVMTTDIAGYTYALGFAFLMLTILTHYSFGVFKFIPLKVHGIIEFVISVGLIVISYTLLQYDERARPFFLGFGVVLLIIYICTDYSRKRDVLKAPIL